MKKIAVQLAILSFVSLTLAGCAGLFVHDRNTMCPECTDEQWRKLSNPTPNERAESERLWKQQQRQQAIARANSQNRQEALKRQKAKRLQRCKQERNLINETDQTWIDLICKKYVQTGSYH